MVKNNEYKSILIVMHGIFLDKILGVLFNRSNNASPSFVVSNYGFS